MKRNMALAMFGDGVFACSSPDGNSVSTTQNGKSKKPNVQEVKFWW